MRHHGEGSIFVRADGRHVAMVSLGTENGRRRRKTIYGRTRREVQEKVRVILHQLDKQGHVVTDERGTVASYLDRWLEAVGPSLRPRTLRFYQDQVRLHITPALGDVKLTKLTPEQVQRFLNARSAAGMAPRTVRHLRATLRTALNQAIEWRLIASNPAARGVRLPAMQDARVNALTPEQARHVLSVSSGHRLHALWTVSMYLGLRQGEVLGLRWSSIDWQAGTLAVDKALQRVNGTLTLVQPKTRGSSRSLRMPNAVVVALRAHQERQSLERQSSYWIGSVDPLIFTTTIGTPLDPRNVIRGWHNLTRRAQLPRFRFHDLRHTAATLMLSGGVPISLVAETLGHRDATMILKVYGHVLPRMREEAALTMDAVLAG